MACTMYTSSVLILFFLARIIMLLLLPEEIKIYHEQVLSCQCGHVY